MEILKKDEKLFLKEMNHTKLKEYYKTKDNSLRIAIFETNEFIAIENFKSFGAFKATVLDNDSSYILTNTKSDLNKDGTVKTYYYFGKIER